MSLKEKLLKRSENACELCRSNVGLEVYTVPPMDQPDENNSLILCIKCLAQVEKKEEPDAGHWMKHLPEVMWSEIPAIQVMTWRMFNRFRDQSWAADNIDMMYFDGETLAWAKASGDHESDGTVDLHRDANGAVLQDGDTVVLTRSLDVKGSTLNAKMGTVVKNIRLVPDNTGQIEGKIEGQLIVILTKYLRKQGA